MGNEAFEKWLREGLQDYSDDELRIEIARRAQKRADQTKPKPVEVPDFSTVVKYCEGYVKSLVETGYVDDDHDHQIFEAAMAAVFGPSVWDWVRERTR